MGKYDGKTIIPTETKTYNFQYTAENSVNVSKDTTITTTPNKYTKDTVTVKANGDVDRYHDAYRKN